MQIINLTPHALSMITDTGKVIIPSSGLARVTMDPDVNIGQLDVNGVTIPLMSTSTSGTVTGLPEPREGVMYVVSRQTYDACPDRADLVITHQAVRENGQIIGCRAFAKPTR